MRHTVFTAKSIAKLRANYHSTCHSSQKLAWCQNKTNFWDPSFDFEGLVLKWHGCPSPHCQKDWNGHARTYLQLPLRQCLLLTVVHLKGKHCQKLHCCNGIVDILEYRNINSNNCIYITLASFTQIVRHGIQNFWTSFNSLAQWHP